MNVRELVTVLKFKTDSASLKSAENAINKIKQSMSKIKPVKSRIDVDTAGVDKAIGKMKELDRVQQRTMRNFYKAKVQGASQRQQAQPSGGALSSLAGGLKGAFVALGGMALVSEIKQTADAMMSLSSRIKLVTQDDAERLKVESALYNMSIKNRASLEDLGDLYYKTASSAKQFGATQEDVLKLTDIVSKSLIVGGADTAQQKSTILQLSQALSSGVLQGDELRSLRENAPRLMQEIAKNMGTTMAGLKEMGAKGKLTTQALMQAILASGGAIEGEFARMTPTIGQALTVLGNKWSKFILDIQNNTGVFGQIASLIIDSVDLVGKAIDWLKEEFKRNEPEINAFFEDLKELWQEMQPLLKSMGIIFNNLILPALRMFWKVALATLGAVTDALIPIVNLLSRIADLIATASGGFGNLIAKAESGAIQRYNSIVTNQTNNVTVSSASEAGDYVADALPMEFGEAD